MEFQEYPKSLYRKTIDDHVIVNDAKEEKQARKNGYGDFELARAGMDAEPPEEETQENGQDAGQE